MAMQCDLKAHRFLGRQKMMLMGLRILLVLLGLLAAKCVFAAGLDTDPEATDVVALRGFGSIGMARLSRVSDFRD